ncbi:MAG: aldo/keto reductase [Salaquimonas sp.]
MKSVQLGKSGLMVSKLCLGCMSFGVPGREPHPWVIDEDASQANFKVAADAGIYFWDTADMYGAGASEEITGRAMKKYWAKRSDGVLATKLANAMGEGANDKGLSRKHIIEACEGSLKRLGTDYIDLLYIHRLIGNAPFEEICAAFDQLLRQGKVLYLGASSMWAWQFAKLRAIQKEIGSQQFAAMQNFYNLVYREEEREMMPYCEDQGIGVVPWSPIARGFLAGNRPKDGEQSNRAKTDKLHQGYFGSKQDYEILRRVEKVAQDIGVKPAQVAYAWVLSKPFITAPIVGATKPWQLEEAIAALDISLTASQVKYLEAAYKPVAVQGHS